jgi:hypothetical protein
MSQAEKNNRARIRRERMRASGLNDRRQHQATSFTQSTVFRALDFADDDFRAETPSQSFVHRSLVSEAPARGVPADVRALSRQIAAHSAGMVRGRHCRCASCEAGRQMLARTMPTGVLTTRDGRSEARFYRSDLVDDRAV